MVSTRDKFNIMGAVSQAGVDEANREFYGKITYPWPQLTYPVYSDPGWATIFLNQELGDWSHERVPARPRIWVAGCGSNQATLTALKFPQSEIVATDISSPSLAVCERNLSQLGLKNVRLEEQSINAATFEEEFDYVICTGVIHHNADPSAPLKRLAAALKRDGLLELMVYNYYHRILTTAYQKAMSYLFRDSGAGLDEQLAFTRELMAGFPVENMMALYLFQQKDESREYLADSFLQPVEHSYTVESLTELLETAGMEINQPCINVLDKAAARSIWNLNFRNKRLAALYDALTDFERWQVSNLLMVEKSPSLYFYAQRKDSSFGRKTEQEICREFLETRFERYSSTIENYVSKGDGTYRLNPAPIPHPSPPAPIDATARAVFKEVGPERTIGEILKSLNVEPSFYAVNLMRLHLTTPLYPYLRAGGPRGPGEDF
ncbi:MAG: class I SAM-dependent methyltransferase [Pyrinomonadaceae bacterium]